MSQTYPYNDDYMVFDELSNRYVLTPKFVLERFGVDLVGEVNTNDGANAEIKANLFLRTVSNSVYNYLHQFSLDTQRQDCFIAKIPSLRGIMLRALEAQCLYCKHNGTLSYTAVKEAQELAICPETRAELESYVPELGTTILYCGV